MDRWLAENGPNKLELLFRAIIFLPSVPVVVLDDERRLLEVSVGVSLLLDLSREGIIGRKLDDFIESSLKSGFQELWRTFLDTGEVDGTFQLIGHDGPREVVYSAKGNLLPRRHLLVLCDAAGNAESELNSKKARTIRRSRAPIWVNDYALFLLDVNGRIATWYAGAERIYGFVAADAIGKHLSSLLPDVALLRAKLNEDLQRTSAEGHLGTECWHSRKDGTRFWVNIIITALRDDRGELRGFAAVVRDFTDRHALDEAALLKIKGIRSAAVQSTVIAVISGEFDRITEANDAFLTLVGYSSYDLKEDRLRWSSLTPSEFISFDEVAHEEALRFGSSTPVERELIGKDGHRIRVLVARAVLNLTPFRWIAFVEDLRAPDELDSEDIEAIDVGRVFDEIIGSSLAMKRVMAQVEMVAPTVSTVLILGETGTGKELVASAIHKLSPRAKQPFITLNCAAIPTGLLESELFGYERGAFTGALSQKIGRFEMANQGTLFLDEVGDIPLELQPKLLRALQEKSFERLGGTKTIPIDVRLIAATNRNLTEMMGEKMFRSDLYYRLRVFPVITPPLRDRPEDIPVLARYFTAKYAEQMGREIDRIPSAAMRAMMSWPWPGNVRELENFIERSVILSRGSSLQAPVAELITSLITSLEPVGGSTLAEVEREHILKVLRESKGVVALAATRLGLHRTTLNGMLRKLNIARLKY